MVGGYSDGTLRIFRLASSEMELKLHPHPVAVTAIQYSANGVCVCVFGKVTVNATCGHCLVCEFGSRTLPTLLYYSCLGCDGSLSVGTPFVCHFTGMYNKTHYITEAICDL